MQNPHIDTHLFHEGVIVASKRLDYDTESDVEIVKSLMQAQHKSVMKELKHGAFDDKIRVYLGNSIEKIPLDSASAPVSVVEPAKEAPPDSGPAEPIPVLVDEQAEATPKQPPAHVDLVAVDEEAPTLPPPAPKQPAIPAAAAPSASAPVASAASGPTASAPVVAAPPIDSAAASSTPYAQLIVSEEQQPAVVSGVLHAREPALDEDDEINGLLSRLKEDSADQPAGETDRTGTWIVSRPGQKERPFDKTGPVAIPVPIQREEVARRTMSPSHLPEVPTPPRTRKMTLPQMSASSANPAAPRRPTPPPTQVNPQGRPSGQYSTVRPAPSRGVSGTISAVRPSTGTSPPIMPKPPTIPPPRPVTPPPLTASGTGSAAGAPATRPPTPAAAPPRAPISQVSPPVLPPTARPPMAPNRSQAVPPVPPIQPRASVQISPPPRTTPTTTGPLRSQNVVPPTPPASPPSRPTMPSKPTPGARSAPVAVVPPAMRRPPPSEGVVVARPAVVIGAPPTVIGGAPEASGGRRIHGREPTPPPTQPESIFGQDLISEKSLDEVIMAYLSEDSNED